MDEIQIGDWCKCQNGILGKVESIKDGVYYGKNLDNQNWQSKNPQKLTEEQQAFAQFDFFSCHEYGKVRADLDKRKEEINQKLCNHLRTPDVTQEKIDKTFTIENLEMPDEKQLKELEKLANSVFSEIVEEFSPKQKLKYKKLYPDSQPPYKEHKENGGWDLSCHSIKVYVDGDSETVESINLTSGDTVMINTGIAVAIPDGYVGLIFDRSSMGVEGFNRLAGVIDSNYRGEVKVILNKEKGYKEFDLIEHGMGMFEHLLSKKQEIPTQIAKRERIAQLVILPIPDLELEEVENLEETERGDKGFGSSGK